MKRRRSLYPRPKTVRGQQCAEAHLVRWGVTLPLSGQGGGRPSRQCPSAELPWLLIDRAASGRWSLWTASQRSGVVAAAREMPGRRPCRASRPASTMGVHPRPGSRRPAVRCPAVRCPVSCFHCPGSGRPVSARPASSRLVSARPPNHLRLVRVSPAVALETTSVRRGTFRTGRIELHVGLRCPERLGRPPESAWRGRRWGGRWGSGRGPGRVGPGRRLRPRSTADRLGEASPV
jgi:hypothetical protein